jgi:hypothetical protein
MRTWLHAAFLAVTLTAASTIGVLLFVLLLTLVYQDIRLFLLALGILVLTASNTWLIHGEILRKKGRSQ